MRLFALISLLAVSMPALCASDGDWRFRVLLDDREIGSHRYTMEPAGSGFVLRSEAQFDVKLWFVSAYRYSHEAVERWQDGCLQSLSARTETNGERIAVMAEAARGGLAVARPDGRDLHPGCVMSFAYWDPRILEADRLLNSQTGELVPVRVTPLGRETVPIRGEPRVASRYRISAEGLQIDLWYAADLWVALEAVTEGGRLLRYELQ